MTVVAAALDAFDKKLLRHLQANGRATNLELASQAALSESACSRRVRALERTGVIVGYTAILDSRAVALALNVHLQITLASQAQDALAAFENAVLTTPEILECYLISGDADYIVRVAAADVEDLARLHATVLTRLPGVARINSAIALRTVVRKHALPVR